MGENTGEKDEMTSELAFNTFLFLRRLISPSSKLLEPGSAKKKREEGRTLK